MLCSGLQQMYQIKYRRVNNDNKELEEKAKKMDPQSFNPRDYRKSLTTPQPRGASAGADAKEHKGRAYFFVGLMNGFANHFKGKDENKDKRKKK